VKVKEFIACWRKWLAQMIYSNKLRTGKLSRWFQDYMDEMWDRQIESDLELGRLDRPIARAEADIANSRLKPLDEVLNNV
jgi:hypothetical protein